MKIYCFNDQFPFLRGENLPQFGKTYTIIYQLVEDGVVWVELEEINGSMFNMEEHFILLENQIEA
jgi:hypothetical protein